MNLQNQNPDGLMRQTHLICFLASYFLAFVLEMSRLWLAKRWQHVAAILLTTAGLIAHTWYLLGRSFQAQLPPLLSSSHDWLLVSGWLLVVVYLAYSLKVGNREGYNSLGLFVLPVVLLLVVAAAFLNDSPSKAAQVERFWTMLHASSLSIGITGVFIGFLISLMYLLQHRRLKKKLNLRPGFSLPPLATLARFNYWAVMVSFPMLTIGLVTGVGMAVSSPVGKAVFSWKDPVVIGFGLVWGAMFILFLWLARKKTDNGRQVAMLTAWAFGFLIVTLLSLQVLANLIGIQSHNG